MNSISPETFAFMVKRVDSRLRVTDPAFELFFDCSETLGDPDMLYVTAPGDGEDGQSRHARHGQCIGLPDDVYARSYEENHGFYDYTMGDIEDSVEETLGDMVQDAIEAINDRWELDEPDEDEEMSGMDSDSMWLDCHYTNDAFSEPGSFDSLVRERILRLQQRRMGRG